MECVEKTFRAKDFREQTVFEKQFSHSEMKEGTSLDQHLKLMKDITYKLAAIRAPLCEDDQVVTLLGSLPRSFAALVTAIGARADGNRLDNVQQVLMHEEIKQSELSAQLSGADSALTGTFRRNTLRDRPCFGCGNVAHIRRYCPSDSPRYPSICFGCSDVGHILRHCPRKREWHNATKAENEESR